jgi:hypothetical protein
MYIVNMIAKAMCILVVMSNAAVLSINRQMGNRQ